MHMHVYAGVGRPRPRVQILHWLSTRTLRLRERAVVQVDSRADRQAGGQIQVNVLNYSQ